MTKRRASRQADLEPRFLVDLSFDGDDWPPTMTENARFALEAALTKMKADGLVIAWVLTGPV